MDTDRDGIFVKVESKFHSDGKKFFAGSDDPGDGDILALSGVDADSGRGGNQAFRFIGSSGFSDQVGQLRFANGLLQADLNGDRRAEFEIELQGLGSLDSSRIVL